MSNEKEIGKIYETKDYDRFKLINGNRKVGRVHVQKLKRLMKKVYLNDPIMVNRAMGILDGQHRYTAARELGLPIRYYITNKEMTPEQIAEMNNVSKKWNNDNYAETYSGSGNDNYSHYKNFRVQFPDFPHTCALLLLLNNTSRDFTMEKKFRDGTFSINNWTKAVKAATQLMRIKEFTKVYNRQGFILAFMQVLDLPGFNLERLMRKLPNKAQTIRDFARKEDFIKALEDIYNWKESDKVRFF